MSDDGAKLPLHALAARALRGAERAPAREVDREDAIAIVARTMRLEHQRRMRRRWVSAGAVAVAAAAAVLLGVATRERDAQAPRIATSPTAPATAELEPAPDPVRSATLSGGAVVGRAADAPVRAPHVREGERVIARGDAPALVTLASGTKLAVDHGQLTVGGLGKTQVFELTTGAVRADVAKLAAGDRFLIRTADAEIEVKGTSFRVERLEAPPPCGPKVLTRVVVYEGVVAVRSGVAEALLHASEQWPAPCTAASAPVPRAPAAARSAEPTALATSLPPPERAELAESNALFSRAVSARKAGDARGAVTLLDELLAKHPNAPTAEHAEVERMRALAAFDEARAAVAARDYLARHPRGFARSEARSIVEKEH